MAIKESDLALHFIHYFENNGFEIYKEVPAAGFIDFVAVYGKTYIAVEVKTRFNFAVLEQAWKNIEFCHYSYIAVLGKHRYLPSFKQRICTDYGLGVLILQNTLPAYLLTEDCSRFVVESIPPKFNRPKMKLNLYEYQKQSVAGSQSDRITHFQATINEMVQYTKLHPGCTIDECYRKLEYMRFNYSSPSSAKVCITRYIAEGVVTGIHIVGGKLFPIDS